MQKINSLLNYYIRLNCTDHENMFIYYLAQQQSYHGKVERLYYKDVTEALGCSNETFYSMLKNLSRDFGLEHDGKERLQLIEVDWSNESYGYWNITLLYNEYRSYDDKLFNEDLDNVKKYPLLADALKGLISLDKVRGYIKIKDFIFSKELSKLRPKAKKLALLLTRFNSQKVGIKTMMDWVGLKKKSSLLEILESLKLWYNIKFEGNNVIYTLHKQYQDRDVFNKKNDKHTLEVNRLRNKLIAYMRGCKKYSKENIRKIAEDVAELYINYKKKILETKKIALNFYNRVIWNSVDETGIINAKYINVILTELFPKADLEAAAVGSYNSVGCQGFNSTYKKPISLQNKHKSKFSNFKNRDYDPKALDEYLKCRDNPEYFEKNYGSKGTTLDELFKRCEHK